MYAGHYEIFVCFSPVLPSECLDAISSKIHYTTFLVPVACLRNVYCCKPLLLCGNLLWNLSSIVTDNLKKIIVLCVLAVMFKTNNVLAQFFFLFSYLWNKCMWDFKMWGFFVHLINFICRLWVRVLRKIFWHERGSNSRLEKIVEWGALWFVLPAKEYCVNTSRMDWLGNVEFIRDEKCIQNFSLKTYKEETTWEP